MLLKSPHLTGHIDNLHTEAFLLLIPSPSLSIFPILLLFPLLFFPLLPLILFSLSSFPVPLLCDSFELKPVLLLHVFQHFFQLCNFLLPSIHLVLHVPVLQYGGEPPVPVLLCPLSSQEELLVLLHPQLELLKLLLTRPELLLPEVPLSLKLALPVVLHRLKLAPHQAQALL